MRIEVILELQQLAEEKYKAFNCKLIPGVNTDKTLGVRVPEIRKLAKRIIKGDWKSYLTELENCGADPDGIGGTELFYEEVMLQGMVVAAAKMDADARLKYVARFAPRIDNWAVCDTVSGDLKFADKTENRQLVWDFLQSYLHDSREYFIRFGVVMLLNHYIDEEYIGRVLKIMESIRHDGYYVKMAVAWNLSLCYIKFPEKTEALLKNNEMDDFTHNKAIQKIRESYQVTKENKERLNLLKRK